MFLALPRISTSSLSVNPPILDLKTVTNGISCIGLSITFNKLITVWISIDSRYSEDTSLKTGMFKFEISFSKIGADTLVERNNTTISLYVTFLYPFFLS